MTVPPQRSLVKCQQRPEAAKQFIEGRVQEFQRRMQRCVQRSQDKAQESLSAQPSDQELSRAQVIKCFSILRLCLRMH
jgi:hypothetical protein